ncbi:fimbria/pilus periplasmic chaperone [Sphingorhabdus arenilitoris]|uniref:Fimbria/pilus periplasmic chaperone n=1 Tax=Sphingorhabdus arenilitoris TaxID=1490041 RepID=A0ABV8RE33_9SPHN
MIRSIKALVAFISLAMVMITPPAYSYDLKPIVIQLSPNGSGTSQNLLITNTHEVPIAIEVRAYSRKQNPDGTETREPEDDDILISPPQMVIAPKASQSFKVQWIGNPAPEKELSYRIVTTQLPIKFKDGKQGDVSVKVDMSYRYEAALYIVPPKSVPSAKLMGLSAVTDDDGAKWLEARILSDGTRRAILDKPVLTISPKNGGTGITLEGAALAGLANQNILVGNERIIRLPWPDNLPFGEVTGELKTGYTVFN